MGLFDLFAPKKKNSKDEKKIHGENAISLAESGAISIPKDENQNSLGESLDHLIDGELPWGWVSANYAFVSERDQKLSSLHVHACNATSVDEEIEYSEKYILAFQNYKKECISRGECYVKYFKDMHEDCCSSRYKGKTIIVGVNERLDYLQSNYGQLIEEERIKKKKSNR